MYEISFKFLDEPKIEVRYSKDRKNIQSVKFDGYWYKLNEADREDINLMREVGFTLHEAIENLFISYE